MGKAAPVHIENKNDSMVTNLPFWLSVKRRRDSKLLLQSSDCSFTQYVEFRTDLGMVKICLLC